MNHATCSAAPMTPRPLTNGAWHSCSQLEQRGECGQSLATRRVMASNMNVPPSLDTVDLEAIKSVRPNLLLCGPAGVLRTTLDTLRPAFQQPVYNWTGNAHASLPHEFAGTLIFEYASSAPGEQQRLLLAWLGQRRPRVQVISTTVEPLFSLVQRGAFLDSLFYHLNTLYVDLGCPA